MSDDPVFSASSTPADREAFVNDLLDAVFLSPHPVTVEDSVLALTTTLACVVVSHGLSPQAVLRLLHAHMRTAMETPMS